MNGCSTIGRLSSAWVSDYWGALNVHASVTLIASLLVLLLWTLAKSTEAAVVFVVLFGTVSGAVVGMPAASIANILGSSRRDHAKLGHWTGMMYTVAAPFALTGPVIAGYLLRSYGHMKSFLPVQMWSGTCLFLSATSMAIAIYYHRRELGWEGGISSILDSARPRLNRVTSSEKPQI
jgi:MCP family monocarboxylic acid transporter-like MFS transporter 10